MFCACQFPRPADVPDDGVAPDARENVMITAGPSDGSTAGPLTAFSFTVSQGTPYCSFDGAPPTPCSSPITQSLPAGIHTFTLQAEDSQGVVDRESRTWTVACVAAVPGPNTLGLFHFDEPDGTQALHNEVATTPNSDGFLGNDPIDTMFDPTRTNNGRYGRALLFQDSSQTATVVPNRQISSLGEHTLALWFLPQYPSPAYYTLAGTGRSPPASLFAYDLQYIQNVEMNHRVIWTLMTLDQDGVSVYAENLTVDVEPGRWHQVVVAYKPGTVATLWVDGVPHSAAQAAMFTGTANPLTLRVARGLERGPFIVDEVELLDQAATPDSVLQQWCPIAP